MSERKPVYKWWSSLSMNEQDTFRKGHPFFGKMGKDYFYLHKTSIEQVYEYYLTNDFKTNSPMKNITDADLRAAWKEDVEKGTIANLKRPHVPYSIDLIQTVKKPLEIPEIRVWCDPHRVGKKGDDSYAVFESLKEAQEFIDGPGKEQGCEDVPIIAFRGYEINIYDLPMITKE